MIVYPAIDIRDGKAVRLVEGDFDRETVFDADPVDAALRWEAAGATWIHIVDLDGARDGTRHNAATIARIRQAVSTKIQLGGGLRDMDALAEVRALGIDRMVIGSAAVSNPVLIRESVAVYGGAIAVGLDARNGQVATKGWLEQTSIPVVELAERAVADGVEHIVFTDIGRDGRLEGPNLEALHILVDRGLPGVIASGGIGSLGDIRDVARTGAEGVIIGAALYHRAFTLEEALGAARNAEEIRA